MELFIPLIKTIHVIVSVILIIVILLQPGKSGGLGAVFGGGGGGGSSESVFGSAGAVPFLAKVTRLLAVVFLLTSLSLGYFSVQTISRTVIEDVPAERSQTPDVSDILETESGNGDAAGNDFGEGLINPQDVLQNESQSD